MSSSSRRNFIIRSAAMPFAVWSQTFAQNTVTRSEARSRAGRAMLAKYRAAVQTMMGKPDSDPTGWVFQWYTHAVRGNTTKAAEISRVFPSTGPQRQLANDTWNTCHAHFPGMDENLFLPWHRVFILMFERIVRKHTGDPNFALPYWNYSVSGARHGVLPAEFRLRSSSLFRQNRSAAANGGTPIDQASPGALDLTALHEAGYGPSGPRQGFNMALDFGLHGSVHVLVGNGQNMGSVPFAAGDPIFWVHHCNIDRLWASWNRNGGTNPTDRAWLDKQFVFADENGARVSARVRDFLDIAALRYTYDRFEPRPGGGASTPVISSAPVRTVGAAKQVALTAAPVRVAVEATGAATSTGLAADKATFVVIRNLQTNVQPEVLYDVYLDPPASASAAAMDRHRVGSINFFHAGEHAGHGEGNRFYTLDATATVRRLRASNRLSSRPALLIAPKGRPASEAKPVIGEISLVQQ